jgi:hypothetical protein
VTVRNKRVCRTTKSVRDCRRPGPTEALPADPRAPPGPVCFPILSCYIEGNKIQAGIDSVISGRAMDDELDQGIDYYGRKSGKFKLRGQRCKELGGLRKTATDCGVCFSPQVLTGPDSSSAEEEKLGFGLRFFSLFSLTLELSGFFPAGLPPR